MKTILKSLAILAFTFSATLALASDKYLNDAQMSQINLNGLQILNSEKQDSFAYKIVKMASVDATLEKDLIDASASDEILSDIYQLNEKSSFKNIFVFVGKKDSNYVLNVVFHNKSDSLFVLDFDITAATPLKLSLENGPSDEIEKSVATKKNLSTDGKFFKN